MTEKEKPLHIRDLFSTGKMVTIYAKNDEDEDIEFDVWIRKPTPDVMKEFGDKASAAAARMKAKYRDEDSPRVVSLKDEASELDYEGLLDFLVAGKEHGLRQQAYNAVLWAEGVGQNWSDSEDSEGREGRDYLSTVLAAAERMLEIERFNSDLSDEDIHLRINPDEDEDLNSLEAIQEEFNAEVKEQLEKLKADERAKHQGKPVDVLRAECVKLIQQTDVEIARHQRYLLEQILYCVRYPDKKDKLYFDSIDEIEGLPPSITNQIMNGIQQVVSKASDIKNLLSLLPS